MEDWPISLSWEGVGATTLLVLAIFLLLTGRLVPRSMVGHISAQRDERIRELREEADRWMNAYILSEEENRELRDQLAMIATQQGETTVQMLRSIQQEG